VGGVLVATHHRTSATESAPAAMPVALAPVPVPVRPVPLSSAQNPPAVAPVVGSSAPPPSETTPPALPQAGAPHSPHFGAHPLVVDKLHTPPLKPPPQGDGENPFDRRH
jgi:hypothetical protein